MYLMFYNIKSLINLLLFLYSYDCEMFMLKYMDYSSRGLLLTFTREDMKYFKK